MLTLSRHQRRLGPKREVFRGVQLADAPILLSGPDVGEAEKQAVLRALDSGWIAPLGPEVDAFEEEVAKRVGRKYAVALSSGTAGLHLGLLALGVKPGDVVVTASMTFAATANAIVYTGAEPFFVDADINTGNMAPQLLDDALATLAEAGANVAAAVPVDLLGQVADYPAFEEIVAKHEPSFGHKIPILADAAESLGASLDGVPAGKFGDAAIFSFNGNKIMTTSGGGMLVTDDKELADQVRYLATQARQPVAHYEHEDIGYNYRLSNLLAALGRAQLTRLDEMIARRRQIREMYKEVFADVEGVTIFQSDAADPDREGSAEGVADDGDNFWLTAVVVDPDEAGWSVNDLSAALSKHNIENRPLWKPMHLQPVFAQAGAAEDSSSEWLFEHGLTLPSGSALTDEQLGEIREVLREFLEVQGA